MEQIKEIIEELYPDGIDEVNINYLFQFEFGCVYEYIGIKYNKEEDIIIREEYE